MKAPFSSVSTTTGSPTATGSIVGETTFGKGTVQQWIELPDTGALKLTIQQFYRPGGDSTQNRGVVSDIELPSLTM